MEPNGFLRVHFHTGEPLFVAFLEMRERGWWMSDRMFRISKKEPRGTIHIPFEAVRFMEVVQNTQEYVEWRAAQRMAQEIGMDPIDDTTLMGMGCDGAQFLEGAADLSRAIRGESVARSGSDTVGPGEFSGTGGRKARPDGEEFKPMSTEQANLEKHQAAFRTNPADPASGIEQGDATP